MSCVHITLVGGQPIPVYNGIKASCPDKVILIHSANSQDVLKRIVAEFDIPCETPSLDPVDVLEISALANRLAELYKDDEVSINISSGTKTWSHFFAMAFERHPNAQILFIDQNNRLWDFKDKTSKIILNIDMFALFRLHGNSLENNYKKFTAFTSEDDVNAKKIEQLRQLNFKDFNNLLTVPKPEWQARLQQAKADRFELLSGSYVEWDKIGYNEKPYVKIGLCRKDKRLEEAVLSSSNVIDLAFHSGWFEYKIAYLLSKWDKAREICLNCRFPLKPGVDKNEIDIIVSTDTKVLFVECKTQIRTSTDIDKFRSVVKNYGGMGSKALFVTDAPMNDIAQKKCEEHKIQTFSLQENHLGLPVEKALSLLLSNELFNINTQ